MRLAVLGIVALAGLLLLAASVVRPRAPATVSHAAAIAFLSHSGVNLPWINYGWDLGAHPWGGEPGGFHVNRERLEADFDFLRSRHVKVCRVFLFCDFRSGLERDDTGAILGLDAHVLDDMQALLDVATASDIRIIPVLMDHTLANGVAEEWDESQGQWLAVGEYPEYITNATLRAQLMDRALQPFLERFAGHAMIDAWDIINEPRFAEAVPRETLRAFIEEVAERIRSADPGTAITVGFYDRYHLDDYGHGVCDLTQVHYYQHMTDYWDFDTPASAISANPVFFGELEPLDVAAQLGTALGNRYAGVLFWSLNADDGYDFRSVSDAYAAWAAGVFNDAHAGLTITVLQVDAGSPPALQLDAAPTYPQIRYRLDQRDRLDGGPWQPIGVFRGQTDAERTTISLPSVEGTSRFYRIRAEL